MKLNLDKKKIDAITSPNQGWINLAFIYTLGYRYVPHLIQHFHFDKNNSKIKFTLKQGSTSALLDGLEEEKVRFSSLFLSRKSK